MPARAGLPAAVVEAPGYEEVTPVILKSCMSDSLELLIFEYLLYLFVPVLRPQS